jgi:predicted transcriptional regulator
MRSLLWSFVMLSPMKLRGQSTIDALILTAALNNEFGITRARLAQELVLTYRRVNKHCEELVQKCLLEYNPVTRTYHATPLGKEMVKLTEQLAVHYTPVNSMLAKYKLRLEEGKMKTRDHARRILKETYANSKSKLSLFAASLLLLENSFMHLHVCLLEALPC